MQEPRFNIGNMMVTAEEIHQARSLLESAAGNHVRGPLQRAGHPLSYAPERDWYHRVYRAHVKAFPHLRVGPGTVHNHVAHVKPVIVHYLGWLLDG